MTNAYVPPGVTVQEIVSSNLSPILATEGGLALVGLANGLVNRSESIQLTGIEATPLQTVPANSTGVTILSVYDVSNPLAGPDGFVAATDFTFDSTANTITRVTVSRALANPITANATTFTLSAGATPAAGQTVRLTNGNTTEVVVVKSVSGQVVTTANKIQHGYVVLATAVIWGTMPDGDTYRVTYQCLPGDYWSPIRLSSMADVEARFGAVWNAQDQPTVGTAANTQINSQLSFAASVAFQQGAPSIALLPLAFTDPITGDQSQPTAIQAATLGPWTGAFNSLLGYTDINVLVPVIGQTDANDQTAVNVTDAIQLQILAAAVTFVRESLNNNQYFVAVLGESSVATTLASPLGQDNILLQHAASLAAQSGGAVSEQTVLVNATQINVSGSAGLVPVGGQYIAAAIGGMLTSQSPSRTITRQTIAGFGLIPGNPQSLQSKNGDAAAGMLVVEDQGNSVRVRHAITLDGSSAATRELNVVRAKHFVIASVQGTLDTRVIGKVVADASAPTLVNNLVIGTLEELRGAGIIISYSGVQSAITTLDPTTMAVQFTYRPAFTVNYITVTFSLDLTTGTFATNALVTA